MRYWMTAGLALLMTVSLLAACGGDKPAPSSRSKTTPLPPVPRKSVPAGFSIPDKPEGFDMNDPDVLAKARELFMREGTPACFTCHGVEGKGDGEQAALHEVKPTDLTSQEFQTNDKVTDEYIYWRIKTGGVGYASVGGKVSAMTGYMDGSPEEVWSLVAYVRSLGRE